MFALLAQRNFFLLWVAHTISIVGDYVFFIAITFWIYEQTGSALATGLTLIASTVPNILFAPLAGMLADRWKRRSIMAMAESARAVLFLGLLCILVVQPHSIWPIYVVGFVQSALAAFFWSARGALLPQLIDAPALLSGNALYMVSDGGVRVIAPALSTFFLLHLGPPGVVCIDVVTFIISAGSIYLLKTAPLDQYETLFPLRSELSSMDVLALEQNALLLQKAEDSLQRNGWIRGNVSLLAHVGGLLALGSLIAYTAGTLNILFPAFVRTALSAGPLAFGWIMTAQALGEGTISLLLGRKARQDRPSRVTILVSACLAGGGLALVFMAHLHTLALSLLCNLIFGAMTAVVTVQLLTLLQRRIAHSSLGRALASYSALQTLAQVIGMGVMSFVLAPIGATWLLAFDGALYLLGSLIALILPLYHQ
jgi:DHA3 family macrolide efflux protein-like MFS transporter